MVALYTALLAVGLTVLIVARSAGFGVFVAFVIPLFLAAWLSVRFNGRAVLLVAAVLVGVPGVLSLIGGVGLFIVPASILFAVAAARGPASVSET